MKATLLILATLAVNAAADETIRDLFEYGRELPSCPSRPCVTISSDNGNVFPGPSTPTTTPSDPNFYIYGNAGLQVPGPQLLTPPQKNGIDQSCKSGVFKKGNDYLRFDAFCYKDIGVGNSDGCKYNYRTFLKLKYGLASIDDVPESVLDCDASANSGRDNDGCGNGECPAFDVSNDACKALAAAYGFTNGWSNPVCCTCRLKGTIPLPCPETEAGGFCKPADQCVDTPGTTPPKTCAANTAYTCRTRGDVCCKCTTGGAFQDPWMVGLNGQTFLFDGQDGTWYAFLHDPSTRVNMRIYEPENVKNDETVTYIDGMGLVVEGEDGEEHRIAVIVKDGNNFNPTCPHGKTCLANGALEIEIDDVKVTSPGHHLIDEETWVGAYNSPLDCKLIPRAHSQWEEVEAAMREKKEKKVQRGRRLLVVQPEIDILDALLDNTFDPAKCAEWRALRAHKRDIFSMKDKHSTIMIQTSKFTMRLEYTMSDTPLKMNNGRFELKEHQRLDVTMYGYKTPNGKDGKPLATGVIGETSVIKFDDVLGTPLLKGRDDVLSGADVDYEVAGPYASEFKAKSRTDLRKLF